MGSFVALSGQSLTAISSEAAHPKASPSLLFPVDEITLHTQTQATSQSMLNHPEVSIISHNSLTVLIPLISVTAEILL